MLLNTGPKCKIQHVHENRCTKCLCINKNCQDRMHLSKHVQEIMQLFGCNNFVIWYSLYTQIGALEKNNVCDH